MIDLIGYRVSRSANGRRVGVSGDQADGASVVVAVDGPSGSGKSTVSRRLAEALGARYLDTGAMYRAVTWAVLRAGADPQDAETVTKIAEEVGLTVGTDPAEPHIAVDGVNVDGPIRGPEVTGAVSAVAAIPAVRQLLVARQRELIAAARGRTGIVVEGRDIGSVVVPDATLKVYLTADAGERARRRSAEIDGTVADTLVDLQRRDTLDSTRAANPLTVAADAVVLDSTELGIDEVVARLRALLPSTEKDSLR
jgi:cytidylate kinase